MARIPSTSQVLCPEDLAAIVRTPRFIVVCRSQRRSRRPEVNRDGRAQGKTLVDEGFGMLPFPGRFSIVVHRSLLVEVVSTVSTRVAACFAPAQCPGERPHGWAGAARDVTPR